MPGVEERLELARRTLVALVADAELPPKLGVHPREAGSHTGAMPALMRGEAADGADDLLGIKWVTAFAGNRARGIDAIHATVVLNDATTGVPLAILDGAPITAQRTAAISGVALREWWPRTPSPVAVTLVGAGVQGASHVEVLAHVARGCALTIVDRHDERAEELASAARVSGAFASVTPAPDVEAAIRDADVVLTMVSFGPRRQAVAADAFTRAALIVSVDYDMCVPAAVVAGSRLFATDDVAQFEATRDDVVFAGYPRPDAPIGELLGANCAARRPAGPVVVNHLGVGLADVVFADAIVRRAQELGLGTDLAR
jgi:ornithine cyclodeaminase/alanine dehydrogenase-like protein (mu-crystallin family)